MAMTPRFPSEVWLTIFDWATFVPFALDTHAPDPFGYPGTPSQDDIQKGIRESSCTKRHLVLVCREWKALATRFLYQAIVITRWETSEKLLCTIRTESVGKGVSDCLDPGKANGQWVERIDILLPPEDPFPKDIFTRLLGSTPNLQILAMATDRTSPYRCDDFNEFLDLFDALAAKLVPSLRVLHIVSQGFLNLLDPWDPHDPRVLPIPEALNGRSLRILAIPSPEWEHNVGETMLNLPKIEHLDIPSGWTDALLAAGDVPSSLVSLSLADKRAPTRRLADGQLSIARNGTDTLRVDDHVPDIGFPVSTGPCETLMHRIAVVFPNLRCLIVHVHFASFAEYIPPVKKLGLYIARYLFNWSTEGEQVKWWKTLCATIERLVAFTPTMEVVRLFHRVSRDDLSLRFDGVVNTIQQTSSMLLSMYKVRFEDIDGRLCHSIEINQVQ